MIGRMNAFGTLMHFGCGFMGTLCIIIGGGNRDCLLAGLFFLNLSVGILLPMLIPQIVELKSRIERQMQREQWEKELAHMGLAKIHEMDLDEARGAQGRAERIRELGTMLQRSVYQEKKNDWAVMGGIAEGIAGPAAGIAVAANAINDNARIEAENAMRRKSAAQTNIFFQNLASQAERNAPGVRSMEQLQKTYTLDLSWSPETLFSEIEISDTKVEIDTDTGAVLVSASCKQNSKTIRIDGALRAKPKKFEKMLDIFRPMAYNAEVRAGKA